MTTAERELARARELLLGLVGGRAAPPDPVELFGRAFGRPDAWQAAVLGSSADRLLLNCCRQSGKSSTAATLAVHRALAVDDSLVLMVSPSLRQSGELLRTALGIYRAIGRPVEASAETVLRIELANGSRIISLPGKESTIRGYAGVNLLVVDEAARVPDELMASTRPMLAVSSGRLVALSTPFGARGWWWREWTDGGPSWERYRIPATDCGRISPDFLEEERRSLGDLAYRSEYLCEFVDTDDQVFASDDLAAALDPAVKPLFQEVA